MSEGTQTQTGEETQIAEDSKKQETTFTPPASQEELDQIIEGRLHRERKKYEGFDELKAKAAEYDKQVEASKTELQKLQERAEKAEARAAAFEQAEQVKAWKQEVSKETGIPADALEGTTKEDIAAHAERLKPYFKKGAAPVVPGDGEKPNATSATGDFLRDALSQRG
jgi:alanyl-tRNA synthetase